MNRIFLDMDGTLAEFVFDSKEEDLYKEGYFLNLSPHMNMLDAVREIFDEYEVYILSSRLENSLYALSEKHEWLDTHLPDIDRQHRLFPYCGEDKAGIVPGGVTDTDLLIDDYSVNLNSWTGKKIKVSRNREDEKDEMSRHQFTISPESSVDEIKATISRCMMAP